MRTHAKNVKNAQQTISMPTNAHERSANRCVRLSITFVKVEIVLRAVRCRCVSYRVVFSITGRLAPVRTVQYVRHIGGHIVKTVWCGGHEIWHATTRNAHGPIVACAMFQFTWNKNSAVHATKSVRADWKVNVIINRHSWIIRAIAVIQHAKIPCALLWNAHSAISPHAKRFRSVPIRNYAKRCSHFVCVTSTFARNRIASL